MSSEIALCVPATRGRYLLPFEEGATIQVLMDVKDLSILLCGVLGAQGPSCLCSMRTNCCCTRIFTRRCCAMECNLGEFKVQDISDLLRTQQGHWRHVSAWASHLLLRPAHGQSRLQEGTEMMSIMQPVKHVIPAGCGRGRSTVAAHESPLGAAVHLDARYSIAGTRNGSAILHRKPIRARTHFDRRRLALIV